jgi:hypothetical protein
MKRGDFRSRIDPKPPLNEETGEKTYREKTMAGLLEDSFDVNYTYRNT